MEKILKNIESINYEAQQFFAAFSQYREDNHAIDQSLCSILLKIVSEVDEFLDSKPKEISIPQREQPSPADLKKLGVHKGFICKQCEMELGQSLENVRAHLKSWRHLNPKKEKERPKNGVVARKAKVENQMLPKKAKSLMLCDLPSFFLEHISVSDKLMTLPDYKTIEDDLLTLIRPAFPNQNIKLYMFGSRISGLGSRYSDLDIFIDIGDVFNNFENRASPETITKLKAVHVQLKNQPNWTQLVAIQNARVPILKVLHKTTSTNCDIGFSNSLGFCNTKLTKYLLQLQPLAKSLCLFVKKWLERTKLNEHITTYSAILLVVSFLQKKKVLPAIQTLQECLKDPVEIGPWVATFAEKPLSDLQLRPASCTPGSIRKYLKQFFKYYSTFDFANIVISPYLGQTIRLKNIDFCPQLPRYLKYMETEKENKDAEFKKHHMNVQDPFQLNHNVTKAVPSWGVNTLKQYFELSAALLAESGTSQICDDDDDDEDAAEDDLKQE